MVDKFDVNASAQKIEQDEASLRNALKKNDSTAASDALDKIWTDSTAIPFDEKQKVLNKVAQDDSNLGLRPLLFYGNDAVGTEGMHVKSDVLNSVQHLKNQKLQADLSAAWKKEGKPDVAEDSKSDAALINSDDLSQFNQHLADAKRTLGPWAVDAYVAAVNEQLKLAGSQYQIQLSMTTVEWGTYKLLVNNQATEEFRYSTK